jgi:hypothetical protein
MNDVLERLTNKRRILKHKICFRSNDNDLKQWIQEYYDIKSEIVNISMLIERKNKINKIINKNK